MLLGSPVPTHTMLEAEGATVTSPMEPTPASSRIGSQSTPPLVDFQIPPVAAAM